MKKMMFFAVAMAAVLVISCNKSGGDNSKLAPEVKDPAIDSLAYNLGLAQSGGLKNYMMMQLGVDSAFIDEFIKGMEEGAKGSTPAQQAYNKGVQIGSDIQNMAKGLTMEVYGEDSTQRIGTEQIVKGLVAGLKMAEGPAKEEALKNANESFNTKSAELHDANIAKKYGDWKKENEAYLEKNKKAEGVVTLPSGVQYKVLEPGTGAPGSAMNADSVVTCDYKGVMINDSVFDSSYDEGKEPIQVNMKRPSVIPGWVEVLKLMPKGAKWEVVIPQEQGYGTREMGPIKPFSTLIFTIETK